VSDVPSLWRQTCAPNRRERALQRRTPGGMNPEPGLEDPDTRSMLDDLTEDAKQSADDQLDQTGERRVGFCELPGSCSFEH
jgi:hypothetical protein